MCSQSCCLRPDIYAAVVFHYNPELLYCVPEDTVIALQGMEDLAIEMTFNKLYLWSIYEFYYMQPQRAINYKAFKFEK